jgi:hypothetical protein
LDQRYHGDTGRYTLAAEHSHENAAFFLTRLAEREQLEGFELVDLSEALDAEALDTVNGRLPHRFAFDVVTPLPVAKKSIGVMHAVEQIADSVRMEAGLDLQSTIRAGTDVAMHTATNIGGHMCASEAAWSIVENGIDYAKGDVNGAAAARNIGKNSLKAAAIGGLMAATLALTVAACPPAAVALHGSAHALTGLCALAQAWRATGILKRICTRPKKLDALVIQRTARGFVARREAARRRRAAQTIGSACRRFAQRVKRSRTYGTADQAGFGAVLLLGHSETSGVALGTACQWTDSDTSDPLACNF